MVDGLVFVWVEKEIISEMIKIMEKQDLTYVENVCWVMLDETKRKGKLQILNSYLIQRWRTERLSMFLAPISEMITNTSRNLIKH